MVIDARQVDNRAGEIASQGVATLNLTEQLDNRGGKVVADSGLGITAPRVLNQDKGVIASRDGLRLSGTQVFNGNAGLLSSQRHIEVTLDGVLDNQGKGALLSDGTLTVSAGRIHNQDATVQRRCAETEQPGGGGQPWRQVGDGLQPAPDQRQPGQQPIRDHQCQRCGGDPYRGSEQQPERQSWQQ